LGGIVWSGFLVLMGYFYGYLWREIAQFIDWIGWIVVGVAAVTFVLITLYKRWKARKILAENNNPS
jgi:membrane protein DedA with SNARE-associated domain